jgi:integrase
MKKVVSTACKGNIPYYCFIGPEAIEIIKLYLDARRLSKGEIRDTDPPFVSTDKRRESNPTMFLSESQMWRIVQDASKGAGIPNWKQVHPHSIFERASKLC